MIDSPRPDRMAAPGRRRFRVPRAAAIAALSGALLLSGLPHAASAVQVSLDTSALAGMAARLEFVLFDGDFAANNTVTIGPIGGDGSTAALECSFGCSGGPPFILDDGPGFGQFYQDLTLGQRLGFTLGFSGNFSGSGTPDRLVLSLLDAATNFTLVDTDLDFATDALPFQDGLLFVDLDGSGRIRPATSSTPELPVSIPEPGTLTLLALGLALSGGRCRRRPAPAVSDGGPAATASRC